MRRRSGAVKAMRPGMIHGRVLLRDDQTDFATRKRRPTRFSAAAPLIHDSPAESLAVEPKRRVIRPRSDEQMVESVGCHFVVAYRYALMKTTPGPGQWHRALPVPKASSGSRCPRRIYRRE